MNTAQRDQLHATMSYLLAHRGQVHYPFEDIRTETVAAIRSFADIHALVSRPQGVTWDCSQTCEALLRSVGAKLKFRNGATGSFLATLPKYTDGRLARVGACVVFGPGTGHHMAEVFTPDPKHGNPLLLSQGQEDDPRLIYLWQEAAFQPHPYTFCSIAKL
jgi:hypothetical protein